ncbi:TIGR00730 family Rossman fold protein [bacterium]|nr:TIGR00730 family Rossman fold protein [bacterium]MBU1995037.1 TIGR00730 family Rossman fold protein [bacterium]
MTQEKRMQALLHHPNYRIADEDPDFLRGDDVRCMRLQADYLKTELLLQEHGIKHTIAVFGGTKIIEESHAKQNLLEAKQLLEKEPHNEEFIRRYKVCEKILSKSHFYEMSREFGKIVGMSGQNAEDCRVTLMTGGGPGAMEAANRGAYEAGAKSIGLNISLPREQSPNSYITPELCFQFHYFSMRKLHFFKRARALVAFPGGYGTMDEFIEALTLVQTKKIDPFPIILVGKEFWNKVIDFDFLLEEGVIAPQDVELFSYAQSAQEIWDCILMWHLKNGAPLV